MFVIAHRDELERHLEELRKLEDGMHSVLGLSYKVLDIALENLDKQGLR